jgi:hypothetical protein
MTRATTYGSTPGEDRYTTIRPSTVQPGLRDQETGAATINPRMTLG